MGLCALQPRSCPAGPCLHAVPTTAWTLRYLWRKEEENPVACLMPSKDGVTPVSNSGLGLSIPELSVPADRASPSSMWAARDFFLLPSFIGETTLILTAHAALQREFAHIPSCRCNVFSHLLCKHLRYDCSVSADQIPNCVHEQTMPLMTSARQDSD